MSQAQAQARFSISDALSAGWRAFTANIGPMALYAVVVVLVSIALNLLLPGPDTRPSVLTAVANLIVWLVDQLIAIGWLRIALDAIDGRPSSGERVRAAFGVFASFVTAAVLCTIAVAFGLLLLVVPGVIAAIALGFYGWVLVDGQERDARCGAAWRSPVVSGCTCSGSAWCSCCSTCSGCWCSSSASS